MNIYNDDIQNMLIKFWGNNNFKENKIIQDENKKNKELSSYSLKKFQNIIKNHYYKRKMN